MAFPGEEWGEITPKLSIREVSKAFQSRRGMVQALESVSLEIYEGDFVCFVGPSGCGKTTLLNMIAGLEVSDSGYILADGSAVAGPGRDRMVMFQEAALFPWLDVLGNVLFGLKLDSTRTGEERQTLALESLRLVGLEKFVHAHVHELSGGMKQRVALARSLASQPRLLLMDEPFGALDAMTREQLYRDLQEICMNNRMTVVFVTHNIREAVCLGNRVVLFSPHPGRITGEFRIDLARPRDVDSLELARHTLDITSALKGREILQEAE